MSARRKITAAALLVVVGLSGWFLVLPMIRFSAARKKYVVGMSLAQVQKIAKAPFETHSVPYPVYPEWKGEMPESAKQTIVVGVMSCPEECVQLGFNSYSKLVEVMPINDPIDFRLWLRSRHSGEGAQPGGAASRSQPIGSETNSTSSAAGSRR